MRDEVELVVGFSGEMVPLALVARETRRRLSPYRYRSAAKRDIQALEQEGWIVDRVLKQTARLRKPKDHDEAFSDRVWAMFARLRFSQMSKGDGIDFVTKAGETTFRVPVLAVDEEVALLVLCLSSEEVKPVNLRSTLELLQSVKADVVRILRRRFPDRKPKFLLATNNLSVSQPARAALEEADIVHIDEEAVEYFLLLADHLGEAARFQLLGSLFAGQKIPALDPTVHAIRGRMGGVVYYFFAIEPERLLKLAYVLHRSKANSRLMPTYQRLIKKSRLQAVSRFVESGGFFPNSIILNLEAGSRSIRFDAASKLGDGPVFGTLHLPQTYRAAYVIDGQHRLYGYANSDRANTELIPVVAFVNLPRAEQVRLFMEINEHQQAVPKNLRNTLNADLLWGSEDLREKNKALRLRIAQELGESKSSALYGRVILGENLRSPVRCLTIEAISAGLARGNFFGTFNKSAVKERGSFFEDSNEAIVEKFVPFLERCLSYLKDELHMQWALGGSEGGFVFINSGVEALLRVLSDIVDHLVKTTKVDPKELTDEQLYDLCVPYLSMVVDHLRSLDPEQAAQYKRMYGSGGAARFWRRLQVAVRDRTPDFEPPGLAAFLEDEAKAYNAEASEMIAEIEIFLNTDIRQRLEDRFGGGNQWFRLGVPRKVREASMELALKKNLDLGPSEQVEPWSCLYIVQYEAIMTQSQQIWNELFAKRYTRPGESRRAWRDKAGWLGELSRIRNESAHAHTVKEHEYEFVTEIHAWLVKDQIENEI